MQTALLIFSFQFFGDAVARALDTYYLISVVPNIAIARERLEKNQLVLLPIANQSDVEGFRFLSELTRDGYRVIIFLLEKNPHLVRACISLGAYGMLAGDTSIVELKRQMDIVSSWQCCYAENLLSESLQFYYDNLPILSVHDMAIVDLLCKKMPPNNVEIAQELKLSERQVSNLLTQMCMRVGIKGRSDLPAAMLGMGYFVGFHLLYPQGFNKSPESGIAVRGVKKFALEF